MSTLKADTIVASDGSSPVTLTKQQAAKSLLNYDHINDTINSSFNTSSVSDDATGVFTVSHTNSYSDTFYYPSTCCLEDSGSSRGGIMIGVSTTNLNPTSSSGAYTTSTTKFEASRLSTATGVAVAQDVDRAVTQIFGDLA